MNNRSFICPAGSAGRSEWPSSCLMAGPAERAAKPNPSATGPEPAVERPGATGEGAMLTVIENLRRIARCVREGIDLPADLAAWLERSLSEFLDHRCTSIDEALGLRFAKGGVPWWLEEAMRARDAALRELAERFLHDESTNARAAWIHVASERYAAAGWIADREREAMPERYRGNAKEYLWRAFKSGAAMPLGERRLRSILAGLGPALADPAAPCPPPLGPAGGCAGLPFDGVEAAPKAA